MKKLLIIPILIIIVGAGFSFRHNTAPMPKTLTHNLPKEQYVSTPAWTHDPRSLEQWEKDCQPVTIVDTDGSYQTACTNGDNPLDRASLVKPDVTIISDVYHDY